VSDLKALISEEDPRAPLIVFVHIPKTAGATVTSLLVAAYSRKAVHKAGNYMRNPGSTERKVSRAPEAWRTRGGRVTVGHVPYSVFRRHLPEHALYMTFLRDPVDRVLSHYHRHIERQDPTRAGQRKERPGARVKADSLEQALVEMRMPQVNNLCTRFLSGHDPLADLPPSALEDAKRNLRAFGFVGIRERFEESVVLLQRKLGLDVVPYVDRHVSVQGRRPAVDEIREDERELIASCNRLDAELYRFGLELFEQAVAEAGEGLADEAESLRARDPAAREAEWRKIVLVPGVALSVVGAVAPLLG
jgi:sulfotransferase famil protein